MSITTAQLDVDAASIQDAVELSQINVNHARPDVPLCKLVYFLRDQSRIATRSHHTLLLVFIPRHLIHGPSTS